MKLKEIITCIEDFAPLYYQESYDNSGLICGNENSEISGALLCLDSTEEVIDEAIEKGCNLVIAHHPIVFSGLKKLTGKNYIERTIIKAIKNDIAIYAAHTNMDNVEGGVNYKIAEKLGLLNCSILLPKDNNLRKLVVFVPENAAAKVREALFEAGAGNIGNYSECSFNTTGTGTFKAGEGTNPYAGEIGQVHNEKEIRIETIYPTSLETKIVGSMLEAHPYEEVAYDVIPLGNQSKRVGSGLVGELVEEIDTTEFLLFLKAKMKVGVIKHTTLPKKKIKKIALCGGSGSFLLNNAIKNKADVFITADFKYHQYFDAENQIVIADIGHYESEQYTVELFYEILKKKFNTFALLISNVNTNPINYL